MFPRKAVDDLLVNDTLLIAVDNLIMPKYILFYKLSNEVKLPLSHYTELKSNGAYETIQKAVLDSKYLGIISSTFSGYVGSSKHITIYNGLDLSKSFAISNNEKDTDFQSFNHILIINDKLIVASKEKGVGILEIKDSYFKERKNEFDIFNYRIDTKIDFKSYKYQNIIGLTQIPDTNKVILTMRGFFNRISYEIIEI